MIRIKIISPFAYLLLSLPLLLGWHYDWGEEGLAPTVNFDAPIISPNGKKVIFSSDLTGNSTIWIADSNGSNAHPLVNWVGTNQLSPDWSVDGESIVFSSNRESAIYDIWNMKIVGARAIRLTANSGDNRQPRYSPDGSKIVFTSNRTGKDELWYMSSDGSNQKAIALQSLLVNDPAWSPDGNQIAYVGCLRPANGEAITDGVCNLYSIALDASVTKQLTSGKANDWSPDWGRLGIVFSSSRKGGQSIWMVDDVGGNLKQITDGADGLNLEPRWDRLTDKIIFSKVGKTPNIWSTDTFGQQEQLTSLHGKNFDGYIVSLGDTNFDGAQNCDDLKIVKNAFGRRLWHTGYDLRADINKDAIIDIKDLTLVSKQLPKGTTCK